MVFGGARDYNVRVVSDSGDHGNCPDTGRSTSGLVGVFVGGSLIVHKSKLQHITTLSSAKA